MHTHKLRNKPKPRQTPSAIVSGWEDALQMVPDTAGEHGHGWDCRRERGQSKRDATGLEPAVLRWTGNLSVNARGRHPSKTHERPRLWKVQGSHGTYMARAPGRAGGGRQTSDQECGRVLQGLGLRTGGAQGRLGGRRVPGCPMPREPRCAVLGGQGSCHQ